MATNYVRLKECEIEETLKAIKDYNDNHPLNETKQRPKRVEFSGQQVKLGSLRLLTFVVHGTQCVDCGVKAAFFAMERHAIDENYHLNLWAIRENGQQVLMTHDHILARSLGGADSIANTQTMCMDCNFEKGKIEHKLKEIRKSQKLAS